MHYNFLDLADFAIILVFFVLPPLFSAPGGSVSIPSSANIPWITIILYGCFIAYMAFRYHTDRKKSAQLPETSGKHTLVTYLMYLISTLTTLMLLLAANFIVSKFASHYSGTDFQPDIRVTVESTADTVFLVFWTALLAAFEEFTYRWLLPERLRSFFIHPGTEDPYEGTKKVLCEAAAICLFALSHRYMGWWAVLNALIAGIIFRTRYFISDSVYPALTAHILYNLTAFYGILKP